MRLKKQANAQSQEGYPFNRGSLFRIGREGKHSYRRQRDSFAKDRPVVGDGSKDAVNILIAEDDFISRKLLVNILEELGHTVFVAEDGEEAWNQFRMSPTRLIISDWRMPRMDGLKLVENIRGHPESNYTYIIMLTANVDQKENYYEAMRKGVDDFLAKPLDRVELEIRLAVAERILSAGSRIRSLEDVLTICAYTKKIKIPDEGWQTIEEFMRKQLGITLTHGVEPDYYETVLRPEIEKLTCESSLKTSG